MGKFDFNNNGELCNCKTPKDNDSSSSEHSSPVKQLYTQVNQSCSSPCVDIMCFF